MERDKHYELLRKLSPEKRALFVKTLKQRAGGVVSQERIPRLPRMTGANVFPASLGQQRIWFVSELNATPIYNLPRAVRLTGALNTAAVESTLNEIVRRHEALRTRFLVRDGELAQEIQDTWVVKLGLIDVADSRLGGQEVVQEIIRQEVTPAFDLEKGPLVRAVLLRLAGAEHVLVVTMHHIVSDGWSVGVMMNEFAALYEGFRDGERSGLEELEIQYVDYAAWQRERLEGEVLKSQLGYWKSQLEGVGVLELATDRARPAVATHRGASEGFVIERELTAKLKEVSRQEGVTLYMVLLGGFAAVLSRYSGQRDIAVGTPIAGRTVKEVEGLIGFFVNTLVMRVNLVGEETVREMLGRVKEVALGGYANQEVPFEKLVEEMQPERSLSHEPLFQVMFALQNVPEGKLAIEGLEIKGETIQTERTKYELTMMCTEEGGQIGVTLVYSAELYDGVRMARMAGHFCNVLEAMVADGGMRVSDLEVLSEQERQQAVVEWNDTSRGYPSNRLIIDLLSIDEDWLTAARR